MRRLPSDWKPGDIVVLARCESGTTEINLGRCSDEVIAGAVAKLVEELRPRTLIVLSVKVTPGLPLCLYHYPAVFPN
jgi:hypothetical protein